jgi:PADRE domain
MGNCQAAEVAAIVVQHPGGKVERLYWPTSAAEVMRSNPGHYVALVTLRVVESDGAGGKQVRLTRVKLLKPMDSLLLGQVYRLITSQGT